MSSASARELKGLKRRSLGQQVYRLIRRMILSGELGPTQRLIELKLAARLGVSRTPVREALHRLEQEGYISRRPGGGYVVRPLTVEEVEEVVGLRAVLEEYAATLASQRADERTLAALKDNVQAFARAIEQGDNEALVELNARFHGLLHEAAGSKLLSRVLGELEEVVERISRGIISNMPAGQWSLKDHSELVEAIAAHDAQAAAAVARRHVLRGGQWIVSQMNKGLKL